MANANRKEMLESYKNRKIPRGIFAVTCAPTGEVWVGAAPNLDARKNGLWFTLKQGGNNNPSLQKAWTGHGESAFHYEVLETLDDDLAPTALRDAFKQRIVFWAEQMKAQKLLP